jgi:hypothetical protein
VTDEVRYLAVGQSLADLLRDQQFRYRRKARTEALANPNGACSTRHNSNSSARI